MLFWNSVKGEYRLFLKFWLSSALQGWSCLQYSAYVYNLCSAIGENNVILKYMLQPSYVGQNIKYKTSVVKQSHFLT